MKHLKLFEETILKFHIGNIVKVTKNVRLDEYNHIFKVVNVRTDNVNNTFMYMIKDISRCDDGIFYSDCWVFDDDIEFATVEDIELDEMKGNAKKYNL